MCSVGVEGRAVVCVWRGVSVRACMCQGVRACVRVRSEAGIIYVLVQSC